MGASPEFNIKGILKWLRDEQDRVDELILALQRYAAIGTESATERGRSKAARVRTNKTRSVAKEE